MNDAIQVNLGFGHPYEASLHEEFRDYSLHFSITPSSHISTDHSRKIIIGRLRQFKYEIEDTVQALINARKLDGKETKEVWHRTDFGHTLHPKLPTLIDSVMDHVVENQSYVANRWVMSKYIHLLDFRKRCYHAWLVFTGRAEAVQYGEDHFPMAKELLQKGK